MAESTPAAAESRRPWRVARRTPVARRAPAEVRRARVATTVVFFLTGAVFATWAARIPAVRERLGLSAGALAIAFLALNGGAVVGLPAGGALVARLGSRRCLRLAYLIYPPALVTAAIAPSLGWLAAGLAAMACASSLIDVAMNAQGVEVERRCGRPILSGLHAGHSFGMLAGGLAGTAAASAGLSTLAHFGAAAAIATAAGVAATRWLVDEPRAGADARPRGGDADGRPRASLVAKPSGRLAILGAIAFCGFMIEGGANDWSAVHLRVVRNASPGFAAAGFTAFSLLLAMGRVGGDRALAAFGRMSVVRAAGLTAACGAAVALAAPTATLALGGWALMGLGVSVIAPAVLGAAPRASEASTTLAIAAVSTVGYLGGFVGPPLIGGLAQVVGLSGALGVLVLAAACAAALARRGLAGSG